ncbi:protein sel-1 homolog 1-like [Halichondria panicea]|uniref:protein sel-1 homolog 1-like n=1 Tax=Halichondria panicea TaxID=6063 RepID=UPI00312B8624
MKLPSLLLISVIVLGYLQVGVFADDTDLSNSEENSEGLLAEGARLISQISLKSKTQGYDILKQATLNEDPQAQTLLAYGHILGRGLERNFTRAFEIFTELADKGSASGQQGLGLMYSLGTGVNSNQAKAVLNYVFAALGGDHFAQMIMGYRSLMGIGVVQSCESALLYYYKAAKKVVSESSHITGGQMVSKIRIMTEEESGSVYAVSEDEMIQYHQVFADSGNAGAQMMIGMFYMLGSGGVQKSYQMALKFFQQAAKDGVPAAFTMIGKMYAEGSEDLPRDYSTAKTYFQRAIDMRNGDGFSGMGMLYLHGMGVEMSYTKALHYFQQALDRGSAEGQYYIGYMNFNGFGLPRDQGKALRYFQLASHGGHLRAMYSLGEMNAEGIGVKRNCNYAVELFKSVSERGHWTRMFTEADKLYTNGDIDDALMIFFIAAELGVEEAESNVAFILEQDEQALVEKNETLKRALLYWNRAAAQGYAEARVKLGDYYYYGQGTSVNYEVAAHQYRMASDKQTCAQAMFNLGYMYQEGLGLEKDFHLAKRFYDMASETSAEAIFPVKLALFKLNFMYYQESYKHILYLQSTLGDLNLLLGPNWDVYLISLLTGTLVMVFIWRRNNIN